MASSESSVLSTPGYRRQIREFMDCVRRLEICSDDLTMKFRVSQVAVQAFIRDLEQLGLPTQALLDGLVFDGPRLLKAALDITYQQLAKLYMEGTLAPDIWEVLKARIEDIRKIVAKESP